MCDRPLPLPLSVHLEDWKSSVPELSLTLVKSEGEVLNKELHYVSGFERLPLCRERAHSINMLYYCILHTSVRLTHA